MREQDRPFVENVTGVCFAAIFIACAVLACEGLDKADVPSDPALLVLADAANLELAARFDCPPAVGYSINWGPVNGGSYADYGRNGTRDIVIDSKHNAPDVPIKYVVRHEMMHVISGLTDTATTFRGVRIADVIPKWGE
jgi:hypothetical protein